MARQLKENQHVQPVIDIAAGTITFKFKGLPDAVFHPAKAHPDNNERAKYAGWAQVRLIDAAAVGAADRKTGAIIPEPERIAMKRARVVGLIGHYESGEPGWSRVSEGGGGRSITVEAIARVKGMTYDAAEAECERIADLHHGGDTKKALAFLRGAGAVQKEMAVIRAERTKAPVLDADKALEELGEKE